MAKRTYCLNITLCRSGPDAEAQSNTVNVIASSAEEAITQAKFYRSSLPSAALCTARLSNPTGYVIWSDEYDDQQRLKSAIASS